MPGAGRLPFDRKVAGVVGGESNCPGQATGQGPFDVVAVQVDLAVGIAGDVDGDEVVLVSRPGGGEHRVTAGNCHVDPFARDRAAGVVSRPDVSADDEDEQEQTGNDGLSKATHLISSSN